MATSDALMDTEQTNCWHYCDDGGQWQPFDPFDREQLQTLIDSGLIRPETVIDAQDGGRKNFGMAASTMPMLNAKWTDYWFYYDANNQKQGPFDFDSKQLNRLVADGQISPQTMIETRYGQHITAGMIVGLFPQGDGSLSSLNFRTFFPIKPGTIWFYFDESRKKQGPIDDSQLKSMASSGEIYSDTLIEDGEGRQGQAWQICELFPNVAPTFIAEVVRNTSLLTTAHLPYICDGKKYVDFDWLRKLAERGDAGAHLELSQYLTTLHDAVAKENVDAVRFLVSEGADVNAKTDEGVTPLHKAAHNGNIGIAQFLVFKGADINAKDNGGYTPLHTAMHEGHAGFANLLISAGAEVDTKANNGLTLLHVAACRWNIEVAQLLISRGVDVNAKLDNGYTPLHAAARYGNVDVTQFLISQGADVNAKHNNNRTALHDTAIGGNVEVAKILISQEVDINVSDNDGVTPLIIATYNGNVDVAKFLVTQGADVNAKTHDGYTPLHQAVAIESIDILKTLVAKGANVNAKASHGVTPLHFVALSNGNVEVAKFLVSQGADVHAKDDGNETPFYAAVRKENVELAKFLSSEQGQLSQGSRTEA